MTPESKEQCYFWDGQDCQYEMLVLGCQPCGHCPPDNRIDLCPECDAPTVELTSGIKCSNVECDWLFA